MRRKQPATGNTCAEDAGRVITAVSEVTRSVVSIDGPTHGYYHYYYIPCESVCHWVARPEQVRKKKEREIKKNSTAPPHDGTAWAMPSISLNVSIAEYMAGFEKLEMRRYWFLSRIESLPRLSIHKMISTNRKEYFFSCG